MNTTAYKRPYARPTLSKRELEYGNSIASGSTWHPDHIDEGDVNEWDTGQYGDMVFE